MWNTIGLLLYAFMAMSNALKSNSSLFESKVGKYPPYLPNCHSFVSETEIPYVITIGHKGDGVWRRQYIPSFAGSMFTIQKALTFIEISVMYQQKEWFADTERNDRFYVNLKSIVGIDNLEDYNRPSDQIWDKSSHILVLTLNQPLQHLSGRSKLPVYGMEEIMNQGFEFIVPNNFERNPPTNQKFLRMALAIVDNVNCRMYDNDDRICFGIPMEGYYMTENDRGSPVLHNNNFIGVVTYVQDGYALVETIFHYVPRLY